MELRSTKAMYVREKAPVSCQIQFICKGNLIHTRFVRQSFLNDIAAMMCMIDSKYYKMLDKFLIKKIVY